MEEKETNGFMRLVVCSAVRHKRSGVMVCGPRHGECINSVIAFGIDSNPGETDWELGFVDQHNVFMTREEAWSVADAAGQVRRPTGYERDYTRHRTQPTGTPGLLFSENLY